MNNLKCNFDKLCIQYVKVLRSKDLVDTVSGLKLENEGVCGLIILWSVR